MNDFLKATSETLLMVGASSLFSVLVGLPLGVALVLTRPEGLLPKPPFYRVLDFVINVLRSVPFIILMIVVFPLSRLLVGRATGTTATIVPLAVAAIPFVARIMEQSLLEVDIGVLDAGLACGARVGQLVRTVLIPEALPALVNGVTITVINIIGNSAMAGAIGGGGLGDLAIRYGLYRRDSAKLLIAVVIMVVIVQIVQLLGRTVENSLRRDLPEVSL
ncbi:MAG: ABC transporter permease [Clostridiaceae bacterium]|jgi:D-methionine transport system permease protein|nr:ABC transporter permease [Clostridiaceae bacterium]